MFWLLATVCLLSYGAIMPFNNMAQVYLLKYYLPITVRARINIFVYIYTWVCKCFVCLCIHTHSCIHGWGRAYLCRYTYSHFLPF